MRPSTVLVGILAVTPLTTVIAQQDEQREPAAPFVVGVSATAAIPVGAFREFVDAGFGINGFLVWNVERHGILGVRLDGYGLIYGRETVRQPLSQTIRRIEVDVTTENTIAGLAIGPQLSVGLDRLRPYVYGGIGFSYFATTSSVRVTDIDSAFASTTHFDDITFAVSGGGGLLVTLSRGKHPISLDLSADYVRNGRVRYLREGGIAEASDGSLTIEPIESETNLILLKVGVAVGIG